MGRYSVRSGLLELWLAFLCIAARSKEPSSWACLSASGSPTCSGYKYPSAGLQTSASVVSHSVRLSKRADSHYLPTDSHWCPQLANVCVDSPDVDAAFLHRLHIEIIRIHRCARQHQASAR